MRQAARNLPLLRVPAVVFPQQALSFARVAGRAKDCPSFILPESMATAAWQHHCSELVVAGPSGQVGVVARVMYDQVLEGLFPTPDDVAHAVATDERVRIVKSSVVHADDGWRAAAIEPIADETMSEARAERLADEAERAVGLLDLAVDRRAVFLEPSTLDDELGPPVCDPLSHPLAALQHDPPHSPSELSLWLAARLPLTTRLRLAMLASTCPLKRMADTVDVLRLLLDPSGASGRFAHRFRLHVSTPSNDACAGTSMAMHPPRFVVGEAAPGYSWKAETSSPHG